MTKEETQAYNREYRIKNREKCLERDRLKYKNNKESMLLYSRNKYAEAKESNSDEYARRLDMARSWAKNNKDKHNGTNKRNKKEYIRRNKEYIQSVLDVSCCYVCKNKDVPCLDFHHIDQDNKLSCVCSMKFSSYSLERVKEEIAKCKVICANCHRRHHIKNTKRRLTVKQLYVYSIKQKSKCLNCGCSSPELLDFHHLRDKVISVSQMANAAIARYSLNDLKDEIEKCVLLCSNCHRKEHRIS